MSYPHTEGVLPIAARQQSSIDKRDEYLTKIAKLRHPACRWWWGRKATTKGEGPFCYVCEKLITMSTNTTVISKRTMGLIEEHKKWHEDNGPTLQEAIKSLVDSIEVPRRRH